MTQPPAKRFPIAAWIILIISAFFFVSMLPIVFMTAILPIWRPEEFSVVSVIMLLIALSFIAGAFLAIKWAKKEIAAAAQQNKKADALAEESHSSMPSQEWPEKQKKPVWPWLVIAPGALLLLSAGPGAVMFPIMPLFLAGMSTDSGNTPDYVPALIILIGYGLMGGYGYWVFRAIQALRKP